MSVFLLKFVQVGVVLTLVPFASIDSNSKTPVNRVSSKPILEPRAGCFDNLAAYNPTAIKVKDKYILIYRGQNKAGTSYLGWASSLDGIHFTAEKKPLLSPIAVYENKGGIEDPRIHKINGIYYLTYTGYNGKDAQLCLASSKDLRNWSRHGVILPAYLGSWNKGWTKAGSILEKKVNGKYWMYYLGTVNGADQMGVASSQDLLNWKDATKNPVLLARPKMFDARVVEPGPQPIITEKGILLIYNGADEKLVYRAGWVLFDKNDPTKVLARSSKPIFSPEKSWERKGQVPNVVFIEGMIKEKDRILLYYGGADSVTGVAQTNLSNSFLKSQSTIKTNQR